MDSDRIRASGGGLAAAEGAESAASSVTSSRAGARGSAPSGRAGGCQMSCAVDTLVVVSPRSPANVRVKVRESTS